MMTFDVTIPVLNEAETLVEQVEKWHKFLTEHYPDRDRWRIVIADNGSTDGTDQLAEELCDQLEEVYWVKVPKRGVGLALKTSWGQSQADIVGYMDLDLATDLRHFPEAIAAIEKENYDLVYGSRLAKGARVIGRTLKREITSRSFNFIVQQYLGTKFSDGMCGFKWLKRDIVDKMMEAGAQNDGWFFSTELLACAEWHRLKIKELPVQWTDDAGSSKVKILPLAQQYLRAMQVLKTKKPIHA